MRVPFLGFILAATTCGLAQAQSLPTSLQPIGRLPSPFNWIIPNYSELVAPYDWRGFLFHPVVTYRSISFGGRGGRYLRDAGGLALGADAAYNFQYGNIVFGPALDIAYDFAKGDSRRTPVGTFASDVDVTGSVRARVGYAFDRILVYATGGYAFANVKVEDYLTNTSDTNLLSGWTAGGGVEYLWSEHATLRLEYRRAEFAGHSFNVVPGRQKVSAGVNIVSAGFSYKF